MFNLQNPKSARLSWDELFMNIAVLTSKRAACKFHEAGVVIVDQNHRIVSVGYNGPTTGDLHCLEAGCAKVDGEPITKQLRRCRGAHGEINAILNCQDTTRLRGATLYTALFPCYDCMKVLNNAGITEIVYLEEYKRILDGGGATVAEDEAHELARVRNIIIRQYTGKLFYRDADFNTHTNDKSATNTQIESPKKKYHTNIPAVYLALQKGEQIMMLRRFNTGFEDGNYSLIAGHIEPNETLKQALVREVKEEAGIYISEKDLELVHTMHRSGEERLDFFFKVKIWAGEPHNAEPRKCDDLNWFPKAFLPTNTIPYVRQAIECINAGVAYSEFAGASEDSKCSKYSDGSKGSEDRKDSEDRKNSGFPSCPETVCAVFEHAADKTMSHTCACEQTLPAQAEILKQVQDDGLAGGQPQTMQHPEYQYLNLLTDIMQNGSDKKLFFTPEVLKQYEEKGEQPPTIRSVFGRELRFNLSDGFPLLTTKKTFARGIIEELLWFLSGSSNIKYLVDHDVHIWDEWAWKRYNKFCITNSLPTLNQEDFIAKLKAESADSEFVKKWGDLVTIYGRMWRRWPASDGREIDQLGWVIQGLKEKPYRKSYVVSAWNPDFIYAMASKNNVNEVPPFCHTTFQFAVTGAGKLNLALYQRSADTFLGVPFNIASYALLLQMVAQVTGLEAGEFVHFLGDAHAYSNHFDQIKLQCSREPKPFPKMTLNPNIKNIDDFKYEDFTLEGYDPHPAIKAEIANIGGF